MVESVLQTRPIWTFPKGDRLPWPVAIGNKIKLRAQSSMGKQVLSKYKSLPAQSMASRTSFGSIYN